MTTWDGKPRAYKIQHLWNAGKDYANSTGATVWHMLMPGSHASDFLRFEKQPDGSVVCEGVVVQRGNA